MNSVLCASRFFFNYYLTDYQIKVLLYVVGSGLLNASSFNEKENVFK